MSGPLEDAPFLWRSVRARYLFREVNERGFDLPLASVTKDGGVEFRSGLSISVWNPGDDVSGYKRVLPGDFVIGLRSFQSGIGYSSLAGLVSPAYTVLRPVDSEVTRPRYFRHLLKSQGLISRLENISQGIRQGRTIGTDAFYNLRLPVPPAQVQDVIADFLDAETARIDALIEKKERIVELLKERFDGLLDSALNTQDASTAARLGRFLSAKITDGPHETPEFLDGGVPFISIEAIVDDRIEMARCRFVSPEAHRAFSGKCRPEIGDVLLAKTGATIGKAAIVDVEEAFSIWSPLALLKPRKEVLRSEYLWFFLRSPFAQRLIREYATQSTQPNIAMGSIAALPINVPLLPEQDKVIRQMLGHSEVVRRSKMILERQVELLKERRQAQITAAVTGQISVAA